MTVEAINAYFTPLDYFFYLLFVFVAMVVYYQWKWTKTCRNFVQILVVKSDGSSHYELAPKSGSSVSLKDPNGDTIRTWPINKLSTIDVPYPSTGFVPAFLQKTIRMVIVDEEDWEPLTNRSPHHLKVMSPDMVRALQAIIDQTKDAEVSAMLKEMVEGVSSGPTREMIASPAVFGNLIHEKISEAVITVNKEVMDSLSGVVKRLGKMVSPLMFLIGTGVLLAVLIFLIYMLFPMVSKLDTIIQSVGAVAP